jgi:hypothetical protein
MPRVSSQFVNDCHKEIVSLRAEVAALKAELAQQTNNSESVQCSHSNMVMIEEYRCADCGWVSSSFGM